MKNAYARMTTAMAFCLLAAACATNSPFPPQVTEKLSPPIQFEAWRDAGPSNPSGKSDAGLKLEFGGRIVQATKNDKGVVIVAEQLPIVKHPVYGPTEDVKRTGNYEFAFLYPGALDPQALKNGNRFIVIGTTTQRRPVLVNGVPKTEPFMVADCIHVWQTGRTEIAEFKESAGGGYSPLPEKTYCVAQQ